VLAANHSPNRKVAFLGGIPVRSVKSLEEGFAKGFRQVHPDGEITVQYLSSYSNRPWEDVEKAHKLSSELFNHGHDVVFEAAGNSGKGALRAAAASGRLAIGVDRNQNGLYPGHVLTSVVKHLDRAVYVALINERWQLWRSPVKRLGLAQGGVSISIDENNRSLLSQEEMNELAITRLKLLAARSDFSDVTSSTPSPVEKPKTIAVAVPEESRFPFILPDGSKPKGMAIDALNIVSEQLGVPFEYHVLPTRRGIFSMDNGQTDAFLSLSKSMGPDSHGVYPRREKRLDEDRAMMTWDLAAFQLAEVANPHGFISKPPIAVPPGSGAEDLPTVAGRETHVIGTLERQFGMLLRGHVKTVLADSLHADYLIRNSPLLSERVRKVADSVSRESSYLVLSEDFYQRFPEFSELLWNRLSEVRESAELWDLVDSYFSKNKPLVDLFANSRDQ